MNNKAKTLSILALFLPLVGSLQPSPFSSRPTSHSKGPNRTSNAAHRKMSGLMGSDMAVHGLLLWSSMGFLMATGILIIGLSTREKNRARVLGLLLATTEAILSIKKFENTFNNLHQRFGLILYVAIWVQALTGLIRPPRGTKSIGIVNVYTGITAYNDKVVPIKRTAKATTSTWIWNVLLTAEVSCIAFLYLLVDKWDYIERCGANEIDDVSCYSSDVSLEIAPEVSVGKELVPIPCNKKGNALKNLFD